MRFITSCLLLASSLSFFIGTTIASDPSSRSLVPKFKLKFIAYLYPNVTEQRSVVVPEGLRSNIGNLHGNWTTPEGKLIATMIPRLGSEQGYTGNDGVYRPDVRYTVQFASDGSYGYVEFRGFGDLGINNKVYTFIETNSTAHLDLRGKIFYAPGTFKEDHLLYMPHYEAL